MGSIFDVHDTESEFDILPGQGRKRRRVSKATPTSKKIILNDDEEYPDSSHLPWKTLQEVYATLHLDRLQGKRLRNELFQWLIRLWPPAGFTKQKDPELLRDVACEFVNAHYESSVLPAVLTRTRTRDEIVIMLKKLRSMKSSSGRRTRDDIRKSSHSMTALSTPSRRVAGISLFDEGAESDEEEPVDETLQISSDEDSDADVRSIQHGATEDFPRRAITLRLERGSTSATQRASAAQSVPVLHEEQPRQQQAPDQCLPTQATVAAGEISSPVSKGRVAGLGEVVSQTLDDIITCVAPPDLGNRILLTTRSMAAITPVTERPKEKLMVSQPSSVKKLTSTAPPETAAPEPNEQLPDAATSKPSSPARQASDHGLVNHASLSSLEQAGDRVLSQSATSISGVTPTPAPNTSRLVEPTAPIPSSTGQHDQSSREDPPAIRELRDKRKIAELEFELGEYRKVDEKEQGVLANAFLRADNQYWSKHFNSIEDLQALKVLLWDLYQIIYILHSPDSTAVKEARLAKKLIEIHKKLK